MTKNNEFITSIQFDIVTPAYLETILNCSDNSRRSNFRESVKNNFKKYIEAEACYTCEISEGLDGFLKVHHYFIRKDKEHLELWDFSDEDKIDLPISEVLRKLVIREFFELMDDF